MPVQPLFRSAVPGQARHQTAQGAPRVPDGRREPHVLASFLPFREPAWSGESRLGSFELSSLRVIWTEPLPGEEARDLLPAGRPNGFLRVINGGLAKS